MIDTFYERSPFKITGELQTLFIIMNSLFGRGL